MRGEHPRSIIFLIVLGVFRLAMPQSLQQATQGAWNSAQ